MSDAAEWVRSIEKIDRLEAIERKLDEILTLLRGQAAVRSLVPPPYKDEWRPREIDQLEISTRLRNGLVRNGVETIEAFVHALDTGAIWHMRDIGRVSIAEAYSFALTSEACIKARAR